MPTILLYILFFTLVGSVVSLAGGIALLYKEQLAIKISHFLASFAAGTLLGTAFFDLLPESLEESGNTNIFFWALLGMLVFFLLERMIHWVHHHNKEHKQDEVEATVPLIILGDSVHNFIDGMIIAATFLVSIPLGIITTFAVASHEIPQEIGDFGILLNKGMRRKEVIIFNLLSAATAMVGALLIFFVGERVVTILPALLALTAGFFIYIAASDLIPEIHHKNAGGLALLETFLLFLGAGSIWLFVSLFN
ncbi:ZIP family metal transporter [Patescibacteria group bacterium]|nr:ZIP family metal transporter [Patescibacteria group bacterium]